MLLRSYEVRYQVLCICEVGKSLGHFRCEWPRPLDPADRGPVLARCHRARARPRRVPGLVHLEVRLAALRGQELLRHEALEHLSKEQ